MERTFAKRLAPLLSLVALTIAGNQLSALAQTPDDQISNANAHWDTLPEEIKATQPIPGTAITSASELVAEPAGLSPISETVSDTTNPIAQRTIQPGRSTRSGPSYIGVGLNIGIDGEGSSLGEGSFAIFSKIGLTNRLSLRPAVLLGSNAFFMVPITVDFPPQEAIPTQVQIAPYLGGGIALSTGDDSGIGAVGTAGIDVPLSPEFTATAGVNIGILTGNFDIGILVGGAYNFGRF